MRSLHRKCSTGPKCPCCRPNADHRDSRRMLNRRFRRSMARELRDEMREAE